MPDPGAQPPRPPAGASRRSRAPASAPRWTACSTRRTRSRGYLLPAEVAHERLGVAPGYRTAQNGRGPSPGTYHGSAPLHARTDLVGVVWVDEPEDRLLPSRARLQTRTFATRPRPAVAVAAAYAEAQYLAEHDPLTRLGNRRAFTRQLAQQTYRPCYQEPFALVVLDGRLQGAQRPPGHAADDAALGAIGRVLGHLARRPRVPPGRRRVRARP